MYLGTRAGIHVDITGTKPLGHDLHGDDADVIAFFLDPDDPTRVLATMHPATCANIRDLVTGGEPQGHVLHREDVDVIARMRYRQAAKSLPTCRRCKD